MINKPTYYYIVELLNSAGIGTAGVDLFGGEWGNVSEQILVLDGVGTSSDLVTTYEAPSFQVLVRGEKHASDIAVYMKAKQVSDFILSTITPIKIDGVCYLSFEESSNIAALGKDANERFIYSMNFTTFRNRT